MCVCVCVCNDLTAGRVIVPPCGRARVNRSTLSPVNDLLTDKLTLAPPFAFAYCNSSCKLEVEFPRDDGCRLQFKRPLQFKCQCESLLTQARTM